MRAAGARADISEIDVKQIRELHAVIALGKIWRRDVPRAHAAAITEPNITRCLCFLSDIIGRS